MRRHSLPEPAILFAGILYRNEEYFSRAKLLLREKFGMILMESRALEWNCSEYYRKELGWPIIRKFLFFKDRMNQLDLPDIKLATNELEDELSTEGGRNINIDPGYLTLSKVVLASTKNYSHRLYLGKGIFGEVTLVHVGGRYRPHLFTYRDYSDDSCRRIFEEAREHLKRMGNHPRSP